MLGLCPIFVGSTKKNHSNIKRKLLLSYTNYQIRKEPDIKYEGNELLFVCCFSFKEVLANLHNQKFLIIQQFEGEFF